MMPPRRRLLERLRDIAQKDDKELRSEDASQVIITSIMHHISAIMNTRQGSCELDETFGIPDFTSSGVSFTKDDIPRIEQEMAAFITRCEPRLRNVHIRFTPDEEAPLLMNFTLSGELPLNANHVLPVAMVTKIDTLGKVLVTA